MPAHPQPTPLDREGAAAVVRHSIAARTRALPDDVIERLRLAARGRLAYARNAGAYREMLETEAAEYLDAARRVAYVLDDDLLRLGLPSWVFDQEVTDADLTAFDRARP